MKTNLFNHGKLLTIVAFAVASLLLINPPFLPVAGTAAAQSGSGEREAPKPQPSIHTPTKHTPRRSTSRSSARPTPRQPPCVAYPPTRGTGREYSEDLNGVKLEMVEIPAGSFCMGSPNGKDDKDEQPQHRVMVSRFYMGKYEVTQAQYQAVMGTSPSHFKGDDLPVEQVSWDDAEEFCRRLSQITGREYRLSSEAEWEYACRAGTKTAFAFGNLLSSEQANFDVADPYTKYAKTGGVYHQKTMPVGSYWPNAFGLYDMHGNVWEWCEDWSHDDYNGAPTDGSAWESRGRGYRVRRGGGWSYDANSVRSATRGSDGPVLKGGSKEDGFRVATSEQPP